MTNHRTTERGHLVFYLRVFDIDNRQILGHLTDISTEGLMLVSDQIIEIDKVYNVKLILPKEVSGRTEVGFKIRSLWTRADANPDFHINGFNFDEINNEQMILIDKLNEEFSRETSLSPDHLERPACNLTHTTGR